MANGGYHIVSLKNNDFTIDGAAITVPGVYESIEGSYRKPILLSDVVIGGVERPDRYCVFGVDSGNLVSIVSISGGIDTLRCTVTDEDAVTFAEN